LLQYHQCQITSWKYHEEDHVTKTKPLGST
jgi:hypothetical protein